MTDLIMNKTRSTKHISSLKQYAPSIFVFLVLASISFAVYYSQSTREATSIHQMLIEDSANIRYTTELQLNVRLSALQRMAARWSAANGTPREIWDIDAIIFTHCLD